MNAELVYIRKRDELKYFLKDVKEHFKYFNMTNVDMDDDLIHCTEYAIHVLDSGGDVT